MQPYLFPYLGYFQLINFAELFVIYEDVSYIKQGWINRNNILVNGKSHLFTVPLKDASSFKPINQTMINTDKYSKWKTEFFRTLELNYCRTPFYPIVIQVIEDVFRHEYKMISELALSGITAVCSYLDIRTRIVSSAKYGNSDLKGQDRIISICEIENGDTYVNTIGGTELYSKEEFKRNGLDLFFLKPIPASYEQFNNGFVPMLSIIDVLMFNSVERAREMLNQFELV
jgi:hypothetical protein